MSSPKQIPSITHLRVRHKLLRDRHKLFPVHMLSTWLKEVIYSHVTHDVRVKHHVKYYTILVMKAIL